MKKSLDELRSEYIGKYEDRVFVDVKAILIDIALESDDSDMMKTALLVGKLQSEVNKMNDKSEGSGFTA